MAYTQACDCAVGSNSQNTPLCQKNGQTYGTQQLFGKAYPSLREIEIAHAMATSASGNQGIVSSVCPIHSSFAGGNLSDPLFGYRPATTAIVNRLRNALHLECFPRQLPVSADGTAHCIVLVTLPPNPSLEATCSTIQGLSVPPPDVLQRFQSSAEAAWVAAGAAKSGLPDPATEPVCELAQIGQNDAQYINCASGNPTTSEGWCYVSGALAGQCPQQILFTQNEPPRGANLALQCITP
jgi:hypothetical protein